MKKINKRGEVDSFAMSPWMFMVLGIVTLSIVIGVLIFYSKMIDVRIDEAKIISDKLVEAISNRGNLNEDILSNECDIFKLSRLNKELFFNGGNFYFELLIFDNDKIIKNFEEGTKDFKVQCEIPGEKMAECYYEDFYLLNKTNPDQKFRVKIIAGSNQQGVKI